MLHAIVTNNCTCTVYDEETGDNKLDENGYIIPSPECFGCFDESLDDLQNNMLPDWLTANGATTDDYVLIDGHSMGWQRLSGKIIAKATGKNIVQALSINGDFTLNFTIEDKSLTVVRSSHDELGASFRIETMAEDAVNEARDWGFTVVE